ncbi:MAG: nuclear transport factor 2 family protein [Halioglobus sp.]|nr:nuclear transport factor 2 family protein [Halioglobus sp.]
MNAIEDELALRNLMARYIDAVNRSDGDAWISTWAEDGVWNLMGEPVSGRENILGLWQQMMGGFEFALMLPSSCLFSVEGNTATGHWYLHEHMRDQQGNGNTMLSRYLDTYTRKDGQWFYQSRVYNIMYHGPADLSGTYTPLP